MGMTSFFGKGKIPADVSEASDICVRHRAVRLRGNGYELRRLGPKSGALCFGDSGTLVWLDLSGELWFGDRDSMTYKAYKSLADKERRKVKGRITDRLNRF